jgi:hypothetical protein
VKINDDYKTSTDIKANTYDSCNLPSFSFDPEVSESDKSSNASNIFSFCDKKYDQDCSKSTGWTYVWAINGYIMIAQAVNFIVMTIGAFFFYPRCIGTILNFLLACCCHSTAISIALAARFLPFG